MISDFGQSEMKTEAFNISGAPPPRQCMSNSHLFDLTDRNVVDGTLRWQAPELMRGSPHLTKEMDIYSFAICAVEVLDWGNIPWTYADDLVISRLVLGNVPFFHPILMCSLISVELDESERPAFPTGSVYLTPALQSLIIACWDQDPARRPPFSKIVVDMKSIRSSVGVTLEDNSTPRLVNLPELDTHNLSRSPDLRPLSPLHSDDDQREFKLLYLNSILSCSIFSRS